MFVGKPGDHSCLIELGMTRRADWTWGPLETVHLPTVRPRERDFVQVNDLGIFGGGTVRVAAPKVRRAECFYIANGLAEAPVYVNAEKAVGVRF